MVLDEVTFGLSYAFINYLFESIKEFIK